MTRPVHLIQESRDALEYHVNTAKRLKMYQTPWYRSALRKLFVLSNQVAFEVDAFGCIILSEDDEWLFKLKMM